MTQIQWVKKRLERGFVTRNEALGAYITRLGAIIYRLKLRGWKFKGEWVTYTTKDGQTGKDYRYIVTKKGV